MHDIFIVCGLQINSYQISLSVVTMRPTDEDIQETQDSLLLKQVRYRSFAKLVLMVLNICMSPFYFGYAISYLGSFDFDEIIVIFGITMDKDLANGLLQGCIPIGGGIGALCSFLLLKNFSRRNSFLVVNALAFVVTALSLWPNQYMIFLVRFVEGLCVGFYSALGPLMVKQFAPTQISGSLGALVQFFVAFGCFFSNFLQLILNQINSQQDHWIIIFGLPLITVSLQTILFLFVYPFQTPKYLLQNNREQDCRKVLSYIYKDQYVQDILTEKKLDIGIHSNSESDNKESTISTGNDVKFEKQNKKYMLRLLVAVHLAVLQQFVGINAVVAYGPAIAVQVLPDLKNVIPVILNLEQTICALCTSYLLSKFGRKSLIQIGTLVFVIVLIAISVGFMIKGDHESLGDAFIVIGLVIFMATFGLSLGPVVWVLIPEIIEPEKVPIAVGSNWASAAIVMILFPILNSALGQKWPLFLFFAVWSVVSFFISQKYLIETKGKGQKQIYEEYRELTE